MKKSYSFPWKPLSGPSMSTHSRKQNETEAQTDAEAKPLDCSGAPDLHLGSASAPSGSGGRRGPLAAPHPAAAPGHFSARGWSGCCFFPHFLHSCCPSAPPRARSSLRAGRGGGEQTCGGRARTAGRARAGEDGRSRASCVSAACRPCARVRGSGRCAPGRAPAGKLRPARSRAGGDGDARGRREPGAQGVGTRRLRCPSGAGHALAAPGCCHRACVCVDSPPAGRETAQTAGGHGNNLIKFG